MNTIGLNSAALNCSGTQVVKKVIPDYIMRSMVLWYDLKKQGATNESMQANPVIIDHSDNGHDANCQNFAWSGMSGIGGFYFSGTHTSAGNYYEFTLSQDASLLHITKIKQNNLWLLLRNLTSGENINYKIKINGIEELRNSYPDANFFISNTTDVSSSFYQRYENDGEYELNAIIQESDYMNVGLGVYATNWNSVQLPIDCDITIEQLPVYPNAIITDGVDDKITCPAFKLGKDYTLLFDITWMDNVKDSAGLVKSSSFFIYNNVAKEDNKLSCFVNSNNSYMIVPNTIIGVNTQLGFIDRDFSIIENTGEQNATTGSNSIIMIGYNSTNFIAMALRKLLLFDRALSLEEIKWIKNNLMEETI